MGLPRIETRHGVTVTTVTNYIETWFGEPGTSAQVSGSFIPRANSLLTVQAYAMEYEGTTDPSGDMTISGGGLTWVPIANIGNGSSWAVGLRAWYAAVGSSPSSMTVSVDCGSRNIQFCVFTATDTTGYDTSDPIGATAIGGGSGSTGLGNDGPISITLSAAPASDSVVLGFCGSTIDSYADSTIEPGTGWTEVIDFGTFHVQKRTGSTSTSVGWDDIRGGTDIVQKSVAVAFEIKAAPTANKVVDVPKGTLSLTSFVPSVAVSDHKLVNVPQGSLLLFGLAPTVAATAHVTVSVPADALSLSTFVPTVTATGNVLISVPLATLSLAATAPLVLTGASQIVQVPKGTLTLAAEAPTVATTANQVVSVPKADLTLTSYEPSVVATANQKVDVPAASLELTGYAPTVSADGGTIVSVPFSSLELTLHAPTIVTPRVVSIPEAVLELVAYEPTIITPRLIDVPSTSLTLTSFAPEAHTTAVIEVPATSLTITGYAPSVDAGSGGGVASTRVTWG